MNIVDKVFAAVYQKDIATLELISKQHGSLGEFLDQDGRDALMHAVLAEEPSIEVIEFLLRHGVAVNRADAGQGWTALHFAVQAGNIGIIRLLLESGADPDLQDGFGNSPLWRAVYCVEDDEELIGLLVSNGADIDLQNHSGVSPIALAKTRGREDIVDLLYRCQALET